MTRSRPPRPMVRLPTLEPRRQALETCVYCPKLCRSACPVSNADPRETIIPWGKMSTAYFAARGDVPTTPSFAAPAWACTGCRACAHACDHENDVAGTLLVARDAVQSDVLILTHDLLARLLATRRASVTVAAGLLQRAGLIKISRGQMTILDPQGLASMCCECYSIVRRGVRRTQVS